MHASPVLQENEEKWPDEPSPDWEVVNCRHGWIFDKSEYENTLVTEVGDSLV
jgi:hypothetical protein